MSTKINMRIGILIIFIAWFLSGWPPIWLNPRIPLGIHKAYAASLTKSAGTVANLGDTGTGCNNTGGNWGNPINSTTSNNAYATFGGNFFDSNEVSDELQSSNFGFALPSGVTVDGIVVEVEKFTASGDNAVDFDVRLTKTAGVQTGTNKADTTTNWSQTDPNSYTTYGGANDPWGTTWTEAEIESTGFGVVICGKSNADANVNLNIDHIQITVYYTLPNSSPTLSLSQPDGITDTVNAGTAYNVTYSLSDSDNVVTAAFYYDTDNTGLNGTAITGACATAAEGSSVTCSWDTTGVTPGSYYVYGITNDGVNPQVSAYSSGTITINPAISISLTTDGSTAFGTLATNTIKDTTASGTNDVETISVDSGPANLDVKSTNFTNGGNTWTLGSTNGVDQVKWEFSKDGSIWNTFAVADTIYAIDSNVAQGQTRNIYLKLTMPTSTSIYTQFSSTVTVVASAP